MERLYNDLKQKGITFQEEISEKASYLMEDGLFLNLEASKEITGGHGWHSDIDQLYQPIIPNHLTQSDNAIKVQLSSPLGILVHKDTLTTKQKEQLELVLAILLNKKKSFIVAVSDFINKSIILDIDYEHSTPKDIINMIINFEKN